MVRQAPKMGDWRNLAQIVHTTIMEHYEARGEPGIAAHEMVAVLGTILSTYLKALPPDDRIEMRDYFIRGLLETVPREDRAHETVQN